MKGNIQKKKCCIRPRSLLQKTPTLYDTNKNCTILFERQNGHPKQAYRPLPLGGNRLVSRNYSLYFWQ